MKIVSRKEALSSGLKTYFTGKPCKNGHIDRRKVVNRTCCSCSNKSTRIWISNNEDKCKKYKKQWYIENKDEVKERSKLWSLENPQRAKENSSSWKLKNKDRVKEVGKKYRSENPEIARSSNRNRKSRLRRSEGHHTAADIAAIYADQNGLCVYCDADLSTGYHVDHIMPLALGGSNWPNNLQCLCPTCNVRKGAKHPDDWREEMFNK